MHISIHSSVELHPPSREIETTQYDPKKNNSVFCLAGNRGALCEKAKTIW